MKEQSQLLAVPGAKEMTVKEVKSVQLDLKAVTPKMPSSRLFALVCCCDAPQAVGTH